MDVYDNLDVDINNNFCPRAPLPRVLPILPDDILARIFLYACQIIRGISRWQREFYPLWLGQICQAWRDCAWDSSELWTTIVLRISIKRIKTQTALLREWLERSKGRPLDIYVEEPRSTSQSYNIESSVGYIPKSLSALQLLAQHSEQWNRIEFHLPSRRYNYISAPAHPSDDGVRTPDSAFTPRNPLTLPLLQSASLHHVEMGLRSQPPFLSLTLAPALRTLSLSSLDMHANNAPSYPARQLTHLILSDIFQLHLKGLLLHFSSLRKLTLTNCGHVQEGLPIASIQQLNTSGPNSHENLQVLTIDYSSDTQSLEYMFNPWLCLPNLSHLSVRAPQKIPLTQTILSFLERSTCTLTQLTLKCHLTSELHLLDFLSSHLLSSLTHLIIYDLSSEPSEGQLNPTLGSKTGLSRLFFEKLHPQQYPDFLPRLKVLEYNGPLALESIDFLEPLIIRSRIRGTESLAGSDHCIGESMATKMMVLRKATIVAGPNSDLANLKIDEDVDPQYLNEVIRMVASGILRFVSGNGTAVWNVPTK